ncbi:MAG: 3-oxoacyl-ACP synthase [Flavobacteriaceae bacterium]
MTAKEIKQALFQICFDKAEHRHQNIKHTIADIDESLAEESKSSSGDELDNSRAMMQIDRENATKQLHEVLAIKELLKKIDVNTTSDYARLGSLIKTEKATYFISLSIGAVEVQGSSFLCIALNSPIGQAISGKIKGEVFSFNGMESKILRID